MPSFCTKYLQIWDWSSETALRTSDHIFLASLNLVFAVAVLLRGEDPDQGGMFFKRSQALISIPQGPLVSLFLSLASPSSPLTCSSLAVLLMGNVDIITVLLLICQYSQACGSFVSPSCSTS